MSAPTISRSMRNSSFSVTALPVATLKTFPPTPGAVSARAVPSRTFSTNVKSRDCSPSPKITGGSPARSALMNFGMTAAYSDSGSCFGPKTLK